MFGTVRVCDGIKTTMQGGTNKSHTELSDAVSVSLGLSSQFNEIVDNGRGDTPLSTDSGPNLGNRFSVSENFGAGASLTSELTTQMPRKTIIKSNDLGPSFEVHQDIYGQNYVGFLQTLELERDSAWKVTRPLHELEMARGLRKNSDMFVNLDNANALSVPSQFDELLPLSSPFRKDAPNTLFGRDFTDPSTVNGLIKSSLNKTEPVNEGPCPVAGGSWFCKYLDNGNCMSCGARKACPPGVNYQDYDPGMPQEGHVQEQSYQSVMHESGLQQVYHSAIKEESSGWMGADPRLR